MDFQGYIDAAKAAVEAGDLDKAAELKSRAAMLKSIAAAEAEQAEEQAQADAAEAIKTLREELDALKAQPEPVSVQTPTKGAPAFVKGGLGDNAVKAWAAYYRSGDTGGIKHLAVDVESDEAPGGAGFAIKASNDTSMNITTDADGGYAVPTGHYQGIITKQDEQSLYQPLGVMQIPGRGTTVNVPVDNEDDGEFVSTAESTAFDRDAPAIGQVQMTLVKYTKQVDMTYELLQDEDSRVMDYVNTRVGYGLAKTHNNLLVTAALAGGTAGLTLDAAAAIGAAEIPELIYKLKEGYDPNAVFLMKRSTEGYLRGLTGNDFQFNDRPAGSDRRTPHDISGYPVFKSDKMPAIGAGLKSLIFGDFTRVGMRLAPELTVLRDPFSRGKYGEVLFYYYLRTVYKVLTAEAIQYATHPTA